VCAHAPAGVLAEWRCARIPALLVCRDYAYADDGAETKEGDGSVQAKGRCAARQNAAEVQEVR